MTNPTQLKIGNLFKEKYTERVIKVLRLEEKITVFDFETEEKWQADPILILEEHLKKAGFRKTNDKLYFLPIPNLAMELHAVFFRDQWLIELSNDRKNIVTEVVHVHELQNLYSALTLKELSFEPIC